MWKYIYILIILVPEPLNGLLTKRDTRLVTVWLEAAYYCGVDIVSGTYTLVFD